MSRSVRMLPSGRPGRRAAGAAPRCTPPGALADWTARRRARRPRRAELNAPCKKQSSATHTSGKPSSSAFRTKPTSSPPGMCGGTWTPVTGPAGTGPRIVCLLLQVKEVAGRPNGLGACLPAAACPRSGDRALAWLRSMSGWPPAGCSRHRRGARRATCRTWCTGATGPARSGRRLRRHGRAGRSCARADR